MSHLLQGDKYAFLKMKAPASYVSGLGRGASGFTTRSDIGPARDAPEDSAAEGAAGGRGEEIENDPDRFQDPDNETGLFAGTVYEADDEEADRIYDMVDAKIDERRKSRREAREKIEQAELLEKKPTIGQQFADLKRGLAEMTDEMWEMIPDPKSNTKSNKKAKNAEGRSFVVPDSILVSARDSNSMETSLDERQMNGSTSELTDFAEIGNARKTMLAIKLEQTGTDSVASGLSSSIDPKGYLSGLTSQVHKTEAEIGDIKRARALLQSLIKTNPKHAPGWVAAAWLENVAGKSVQARKIIAQGCEYCNKNEDVWIAASELNTNENAKVILANAVQELPQSVRIWMRAVELESEVKAKKRVLRKALEYIPASVRLWKETVKLETSPEDARILLSRAVEVIPTSSELWLALARLETPERARGVLNKARKTIPTSHEIWIAAGRLAEQEGNEEQVESVITNGVAALKRNGAELSREKWLEEAEKAEVAGSPMTSQAIIKATLHLDVEEEDRQDVWMDDAKTMESKGLLGAARAIYAYCLKVFPQKQAIWRKAAELEKEKGTRATLLALLDRAVESVPQAEILWLMAAKESWLSNDVPGARAILGRAFSANPESEGIWLAAIKLEAENDQIEAAKQLMSRARTVAGTERIWIKSAVFERQHGTSASSLATVKEGLVLYPTSSKLHLIHCQLLLSAVPLNIALTREALALGIKKCPTCVPLWIMSSRLEEGNGLRIKARALLEKARGLNGKSEEIWLESVKVEERDGNGAEKAMLARAIQALPTSGLLHSYSIFTEVPATRLTRSLDALKKTNNSPHVIVTIGRLFWSTSKVDKARNWFGRAVAADGDFGDAWGWWYRFEEMHGNEIQKEHVVSLCITADPHHGAVWQSVVKDPQNVGKGIKELLTLVAHTVEKAV